jgi:hypothetical protein
MKNYKILAYLFSLTLLFNACEKADDKTEPDPTPTPAPTSPISDVPASFTQKVLIEKYTGEWCVNCPSGSEVLKGILTKFPENVIAANVHQGDWLEIPQLKALSDHLGGIGGYPRASINRVPAQGTTGNQDGFIVYSRGNWDVNTTRLVDLGGNKTAKHGLALETKLEGNILNIKVHCGFKDADARDTRVTLYLVEDGIQAVKQTGATTNPYIHEHTLRKVLTAATGDAIKMESGKKVVKEFNGIDVSAYKSENLEVIAFVNVVGPNNKEHQVLNVQSVKAGKNKNWD